MSTPYGTPNTTLAHLARAAAVALPLAGAMLAVSGCTHSDIAAASFFRQHRDIAVEITGEAPVLGAPVAVDIHNHMGSVIVEVDDRLDAPEITASLIRSKELGDADLPAEDAPETVTAAYEYSTDAGVPASAAVLRINAGLTEGYPMGSSVALRVRVPRCDGLEVSNNNGAIVILGTKGAVTAQSGGNTGVGGRIEFRTSHPLRDPVALVTTDGRVTAVIHPEGAARIELDTEQGQANFGSKYGSLTEVRPGLRSYRGTWNGGKNPFVARSGDGDITVFVKYDAEEYSTADDWMALLHD